MGHQTFLQFPRRVTFTGCLRAQTRGRFDRLVGAAHLPPFGDVVKLQQEIIQFNPRFKRADRGNGWGGAHALVKLFHFQRWLVKLTSKDLAKLLLPRHRGMWRDPANTIDGPTRDLHAKLLERQASECEES